MESAKKHSHSLQDHHLLLLPSSSSSFSSSSTLDSSSSYGTAAANGSSHLYWTPFHNILNCGSSSLGGSSRNYSSSNMTPHDHDLMSFDQWAESAGNNSPNFTNNLQPPSSSSPHDLQQLSQIKQELSAAESNNNNNNNYSSLRFTDHHQMISSPSISSTIDQDQQQRDDDINVKLLLRTLSSSCPNQDFYSSSPSPSPPSPFMRGGTLSHIYPTVNVSSNIRPTSTNNFDMNLEALDLFNSAGFGGEGLRQSLMQDHQLGLSTSSGLSYNNGGLDYDNYMKQSIHHERSFINSTNMTPNFSNGVAEAKLRSSVTNLETVKAPQPAAKRSRLDSRPSCPPFKVRKEKLGDRIAALQQLVAPFGKTDTASVLMEAIGYIKFLQSQVETLSVPYLKSSRNNNNNKTQRAHVQGNMQGGPAAEINGSHNNNNNNKEERKRDLRSRGLCLVPLSCLSYMTDTGGAVWPPPNFPGGT